MFDLQSLANLGEVIGAAGVVASLLYLAVQVRQGTKAQRTENYARALGRIATMQSTLSQDSEVSGIFTRGVQDATNLTALERIRFTWALYEMFDAFEFMFYTYENDEIPEEVWARWSQTLAYWLSFPGVTAWWDVRPVHFTESFTVFVETLVRDNPTDKAATERWQQFVTGRQAPADTD
jgi:hypothetical protein